jgi:hypothetical protein
VEQVVQRIDAERKSTHQNRAFRNRSVKQITYCGEISGSYYDEYEDGCLLRYCAVWSSFIGAYCLHHQGDDDGGSEQL